jgi:chorismate mutase
MDNRINEIRRRISVLRAEMVRAASAMHDQIRRDLDCTEAALQLMGLRNKLAVLVAEWKAAGGSETPPTIEERLKANSRPAKERKALTRR